MTGATVTTGRRGRVTLGFELQGALAASRNLGLLADRLPWVQRRAIQTLRRRLPVQARRDIQAEYNLTAQRINQDLVTRADDRGVRLIGRFRGIGLRNFAARRTAKGVTASILRGRRSLRKGAFFAPLLGGNTHVVERYGEKRVMTQGRYKGKRRQPIAVEYGATVAQMLAKGRRPERLADFARGVLGDELERLLAYYDRPGGFPTTTREESP